MDHTERTEALKTAKTLIAAHGITCHMNKHSRDLLSRDVPSSTASLRYEFLLDPTRNSWSDNNPSCSIVVNYSPPAGGGHLNEEGSMVLDHHLRVAISASANDMDLRTTKQREGMMTMLFMLGEMLEASLPQKVTSLLETAAEIKEKKQRADEQRISKQIIADLGTSALKGLRKGGSPRSFRLTSGYSSLEGKYPDAGTYRFKYVRATDKRGNVKDVAYYSIRVFSAGSDIEPPSVSIRRVEEVQSM